MAETRRRGRMTAWLAAVVACSLLSIGSTPSSAQAAADDADRVPAVLALLYAPQGKQVNPPGEWNTARVLVRGDHVEHWLNGKKIVEFELSSKELLALVEYAKSVVNYGAVQQAPLFGQ